jgi:hypothetical protein
MTFEPEPQPVHLGRDVVDARLAPVGKITDVLFDDREAQATWAVVKTGIFGGEHYMPLVDSYVDEAGRLVVPFDKASVKRAPRASREHVISPTVAGELRHYYGVAA